MRSKASARCCSACSIRPSASSRRQAGARGRPVSMDALADKPHILVVDDDTRLRELLKSFLSRNGFRVTTAGHAAEARQQPRRARLRPDRARRHDAGPDRPRLRRRAAQDRRRADPDADRHGRAQGPHRRPGEGRRRLSRQAVRAARAAAAHPERAAPRTPAGRTAAPSRRVGEFRPLPVRPRAGRAHAEGQARAADRRRGRAAARAHRPAGRGAEPRDAVQERGRGGQRARHRRAGDAAAPQDRARSRLSRAICAPSAARAIGWSTHDASAPPATSSNASPALPTGIRRRPCSRAR